jgi:hypothetical protein
MELPENNETPEVAENTEQSDLFDFIGTPTEDKPEPEPQKPEPAISKEIEEDEIDEPRRPSKSREYTARQIVRLLNEGNLWLTVPLCWNMLKKKVQRITVKLDWQDAIEAAEDGDTQVLTPEEISKINSVAKKFEKKFRELPFTDQERDDLQQAFAEYTEATGNLDLPPGVALAVTVVSIMGKRVGTLYMNNTLNDE